MPTEPKSGNSKKDLDKIVSEIDWSEADALTDEEITEAAKADPDALPVGKDWFDRAAARRRAKKEAAE